LEKARQQTIRGLFKFTCGNIRPIYGYFKIKGCDKKSKDKLREQKAKERGKKRFRRVESTHLIQAK